MRCDLITLKPCLTLAINISVESYRENSLSFLIPHLHGKSHLKSAIKADLTACEGAYLD